MTLSRRSLVLAPALVLLGACGRRPAPDAVSQGGLNPGDTPEMRALIRKYARVHDIPESLLRRVIKRESNYNPRARNGPYYGLMQILPQTARTMGYQGPPEGLLDAETNLLYAGRYLRGAWLVSGGSQDRAVMWYAKGYYYEAKRLGLLEETGLRT
jgi:soluble lytic murein transglycosylase-like protein